MQPEVFHEKVELICDPYYDREFFTNLIYCIDRKKTVRDLFDQAMSLVNQTDSFSSELDAAIYHLFFSYQAANAVKANYQWLPLAQGLYTLALFRGNGQALVKTKQREIVAPEATTAKDFESSIRREVRAVESEKSAWASLLFLLENRSSRSQAAASLVRQALIDSDPMTFGLLVKGLDLSLAGNFKSTATILFRPFERFWGRIDSPDFVGAAVRLAAATPLQQSSPSEATWQEAWTTEIWSKLCTESSESVWSLLQTYLQKGAYIEQFFAVIQALRGKLLFQMKAEHWPQVLNSLLYGEALHSASKWSQADSDKFLAVSVFDLSRLLRTVSPSQVDRPTGEVVLDGVSANISKDRLILRLDDAIERGDRELALEILSVILKDQGLSHSLADRLILIASKQDSWTFDCLTISGALVVSKAFELCQRHQIRGHEIGDACFGLVRFLTDQRAHALSAVKRSGTYGDRLPASQYDVSGGARIVDRFVFNQMRNAQRVKVWPSDN